MPRRADFVPRREWTDRRHLVGLQGEEQAIAFLTSCGWSVETHRFRLGRWEIDLVARLGRTVAFVEVKTRQSDACGSPLEAVSALKAERLGRVAAIWSLRYGRPGDEYRFDLVGVTLRPGRPPLVEHVPDAWRLGEWRGRR